AAAPMEVVGAAEVVADAVGVARRRHADYAADAAGCPLARPALLAAGDRYADPAKALWPDAAEPQLPRRLLAPLPNAHWPGAARRRPAPARRPAARRHGHAGLLPTPPFEPPLPAPTARA